MFNLRVSKYKTKILSLVVGYLTTKVYLSHQIPILEFFFSFF